ncbi:MAG: hypothetical protein K2L53_02520, partial [Clostridia bacterium]|nr:hypothetical protein [Clostridia bacterium]
FALRANLSKNLMKYVKEKKAKEAESGNAQEEQKPFEDVDSGSAVSQEAPKTQKNTENNQDDDPFV